MVWPFELPADFRESARWWEAGPAKLQLVDIELLGHRQPLSSREVTWDGRTRGDEVWLLFELVEDTTLVSAETAELETWKEAKREATTGEGRREERSAELRALLTTPFDNPFEAALLLHGIAALVATARAWRRSRAGAWESLQTRLAFQKLFWTRFYLVSVSLLLLGAWLSGSVLGSSVEGEPWLGWEWLAGGGIGLALAAIGQFVVARLHLFTSGNRQHPSRVGVVRRPEPEGSSEPPPAGPGQSDDW